MSKIYKEINKDENKFLKISIDYELGGYGGFDWNFSPRGYYIYLREVEKEDGWERFTLLGNEQKNYKIKLKEVKRQNKRELDLLCKTMQEHSDTIYRLWQDHRPEEIKSIFKGVI